MRGCDEEVEYLGKASVNGRVPPPPRTPAGDPVERAGRLRWAGNFHQDRRSFEIIGLLVRSSVEAGRRDQAIEVLQIAERRGYGTNDPVDDDYLDKYLAGV